MNRTVFRAFVVLLLASLSTGAVDLKGKDSGQSQESEGSRWAKGWHRLGTVTLENSGAGQPQNTSISSVTGASNIGAMGVKAVIRAWSGGILRSATNQLVLSGGGHGDYGGNELYAFNFTSSRAGFERLRDAETGVGNCRNWTTYFLGLPPIPASGECGQNPSPTSPNSRHTYGGLAYVPSGKGGLAVGHDGMFLYSGSVASAGGGPGNDLWIYDFVAKTWSMRKPVGQLGTQDVGTQIIDWYDSGKGGVAEGLYIVENGAFRLYNPISNQVLLLHRSVNFLADYPPYGVIDSHAAKFVVFNPRNNSIVELPLDGSEPYTANPAVGCPTAVLGKAPGMAYDASARKIALWNGDGNLYLYDAKAHVCTNEAYANGPQWRGAPYGRFRYLPEKEYFVVLTDYDVPGYLLCRKADGCAR